MKNPFKRKASRPTRVVLIALNFRDAMQHMPITREGDVVKVVSVCNQHAARGFRADVIFSTEQAKAHPRYKETLETALPCLAGRRAA